jgi:hypothetical protein
LQGQSLRIDLTGGTWNAVDRLDVSYKEYTGNAYTGGGLDLSMKVSYVRIPFEFSPLLIAHYHFPTYLESSPGLESKAGLLGAGIEKAIPVGYAQLTAEFAIGYNWDQHRAVYETTATSVTVASNDIVYRVLPCICLL